MFTTNNVSSLKLIHVSHAPYGNGQLCDGGNCPALYETKHGTYVIIGRRLSEEEKRDLPMDRIEDALEIPKDLLIESAHKLM